jgi:hypothetical protein
MGNVASDRASRLLNRSALSRLEGKKLEELASDRLPAMLANLGL